MHSPSLLCSIALVSGAALTTPPAVAANQAIALPDAAQTVSAEVQADAFLLASAIVDIGYPEEQREALFFATMDQTVAQLKSALGSSLPQDDPGAMAIFDDWVAKYTAESKQVLRKHIPSIMAGMTEAYARIFSVEELTDILKFVETPSGKKFFELSPAVMGDSSFTAANERYIAESMELLGPAQSELLSELQDYMAKQQPVDGTVQS